MKTALRGCGCIPWTEINGVYHSRYCRRYAGSKLTRSEHELWIAQNLAAEKVARELEEAINDHPAGKARSIRDGDYVDAHLDDDDDREGEPWAAL